AMEDAIALAQAFERHPTIAAALNEYEQARKPRVEALQQAAAESQRYFEHTSRYQHFAPLQRAFHLLTRSGRITYDNLKQRDPAFVSDVERWFAEASALEPRAENREPGGSLSVVSGQLQQTTDYGQQTTDYGRLLAPPAMWTPLVLRGLQLANRIVLAVPLDN